MSTKGFSGIEWQNHTADKKLLKKAQFGAGKEAKHEHAKYMAQVYMYRAEVALKEPTRIDAVRQRIEKYKRALVKYQSELKELQA